MTGFDVAELAAAMAATSRCPVIAIAPLTTPSAGRRTRTCGGRLTLRGQRARP